MDKTVVNRPNLIPKNYPRRPGSDDVGRDYEIKMTALLSLRCAVMEDTQDMWLGSNVDQVGDFDDIVLCRRTSENRCIAYLMQLKHQESPKNIMQRDFTYSAEGKKSKIKKSKEDFSLSKYYTGFVHLNKKLETVTEDEFEVIRHLRRCDKMVLVLFTNRDVNKCDIIENNTDGTLQFLNTSSSKDCIYIFDQSKLNYDPNFLANFVLFTNQIHINQVDKMIKTEIKKLVGVSKTNNIDYKKIANDFMLFIKMWIKAGEFDERVGVNLCNVLTKCNIINKLTDLLLDPFKLNFSKESYTFSNSTFKDTWSSIIYDKSIVISEFSDDVIQFLKQFIGSNVREYCGELKQTWADHLSTNIKVVLSKNDWFVNAYILFDSHEEITPYTIYQCLWFSKKLPLLLYVNNNEDYQNIIKILKLSYYELRVVIITPINQNFKRVVSYRSFVTLRDLNEASRTKILNVNINLQGRTSIKLGNLIDESMYDYLTCRDIVHILLEDFSIGQVYESLPSYFIESRLLRIFLKFDVLYEINDEIFVIENKMCSNNTVKKLDDSPNIIILGEDNIEEQIQELKSDNEVIHRLILCAENLLEWKESFGSTKNIKRYQVVINKENLYKTVLINEHVWEATENIIMADSYLNNFHLLSATPGVGKTTFMDFIAARAPASVWVLKIALNDYNEYYENMNKDFTAIDHLKYFNNSSLKRYNCCNVELSKMVFEKLCHSKKIIVLLDGFDEIFFSYRNEVMKLGEQLHKEGFCIWLTTRPYMQSDLEEQFYTISTTLKPFTVNDQKRFLTKYFADILPCSVNNKIAKEFTEKLLEAAKFSLSDNDKELTGIALQIKLIADVFYDDLEKSIYNNVVSFNDRFNLLYIYEQFIKKKADILGYKYGKGAKEMCILFEKLQKLCALKICLPNYVTTDFNVEKQLEEYYRNEQNQIYFLQREGIIVVGQDDAKKVQKFDIKFVHNTFAWYFAAKWFSENLDPTDDKLKRAKLKAIRWLSNNRYHNFLFKMFNFMLAKGCSLHTAVLMGQIEEAVDIIKATPNKIDTRDKLGRTVLHLVSIYGVNHDELDEEDLINISDKMINIITEIPNYKIKNIRDNAGYSPLDYAVNLHAMAVANCLCEKLPNSCLIVKICGEISSLDYCLILGYKSLFNKVLLPSFASQDLLLGNLNRNETIRTYCSSLNSTKTFDDCIEELHATTLIELFQYKKGKNSTENPDYFCDLRFAVAFSTEDNVLYLLRTDNEINKQDCYGNISLHYAALHGRLEIVKLLISKGANSNQSNDNNDTPLHFAAKRGHADIVAEIVSTYVDINLRNDSGDTPLSTALHNGHVNAAKILFSNNAEIKSDNRNGKTLLHYASEIGANEIVQHLLSKGAEINKQTEQGETPLILALNKRQISTSKLLLFHGADVTGDIFGFSPLHYAAEIGDDNIILDLLSKEVNINRENYANETPLFWALKAHNVDTAKLLLSKGAVTEIQNKDGDSILHYAVQIGNEDIILHLLSNEVDINKTNNVGETPLISALKSNNIGIAKLLLSKGAEIKEKHSYINFCCPLLYAVTEGIDEIIPDLLLQGVNINRTNLFGETPLLLAFRHGHATTAKLLLANDADVTVKNKYSQTVIYYAVRYALLVTDADVENQIEILNTLLDNSNSINKQDWEGYTPLHSASCKPEVAYDHYNQEYDTQYKLFSKNVVSLLLSKGAEINLKNKNGETALDLAMYYKNMDVVSLLNHI